MNRAVAVSGPPPSEIRLVGLRLRKWRRGDAGAWCQAIASSDAHLRPWIPFMQHEPRSLAQATEMLEQARADFEAGGNLRYALWVPQVDGGEQLVGEVMLLQGQRDERREVGYWLHVDHGGRGLATMAVQALVALGFDTMGLTRLTFRCDRRNEASRRIPERLGASCDSTQRVPDLVDPSVSALLEVWVLDGPIN